MKIKHFGILSSLFLGSLAFSLLGCGGAAGGIAPGSPAEASSPSRAYSEAAPAADYGAPSAAYGGDSGGMASPSMAPAAEPAGAGMGASAPAGVAAPAAPPPPPPAMPAPTMAAESSAAKPVAKKAVDEEAPMPVMRTPPPPPQGGLLTAGVWDDNRNFEHFKPFAEGFMQNGQDFSFFSMSEMLAARDRSVAKQNPKTDLDVQLVIDTTGSMGDELRFLQGEFLTIVSRLHEAFPNVTPRWSLILYKDAGDEYITREFDFTKDTQQYRSDLARQSAGGGGDMPEAVVPGLTKGMAMGWRGGNNVAKVVFWVADAPTHPGEGPAFAKVVRRAQSLGVHIYPIASSGIDDVTEYQMRAAAQFTGGRYMFLTDDSGIGNSHAEPHIPCYNVTRLDTAIVRMLRIELTGSHIDVGEQDVIRRVGSPVNGQCKLPGNRIMMAF